MYSARSTRSAGLELFCLSNSSFPVCPSFVCMCEAKKKKKKKSCCTYTCTEPFVKRSSKSVVTRHSLMAYHSAAVVKLGLARSSRVEHAALDVDTGCARGVGLCKALLYLNSSALCARDRGELMCRTRAKGTRDGGRGTGEATII